MYDADIKILCIMNNVPLGQHNMMSVKNMICALFGEKLAQTLDRAMAKLWSKTRSSEDEDCTGHLQTSGVTDLFRS